MNHCLKILVVGYGSIGKRHVTNLLTIPNIEIIICTHRNDIDDELKTGLVRIKENQKKKIVAFKLLERGIPREHYKIQKNGQEIGEVTSGTLSPTLKKGIGLALVGINYADLETEIDINIRNRLYKGKIVKKPFYAYKGK